MTRAGFQTSVAEGREKRRLEVLILDKHLTAKTDVGYLREQTKRESVRRPHLYLRLRLPTREPRATSKAER